MRSLLVLMFAVVIGACAIEPISERGNYVTYGHGSRQSAFKEAYDHAAQWCEKKGMVAMQTSTVCPDRCVTNFECTAKK